MAKYRVEDIRNIALLGHGASGKTSLADALLFKAGAVDRKGSPDDGRGGLARMLVINKMDADNIHFDELLATITRSFGKSCVLFNAPNGLGAKFTGVVSVLNPPASPPAGMPADIAQARSKLVDAIVEADDALTATYLLEGTVGCDELLAAIRKALAAGPVI